MKTLEQEKMVRRPGPDGRAPCRTLQAEWPARWRRNTPWIGLALGLVLGHPAWAGSFDYTYDAAGRLVGAQADNNSVITYSYDANGNLLDRTSTAVATNADLQISKSSDFFAVTVGFDLNFTLEVSNAGPDAATDVTVTDPLPFGLVFSSGGASQGGFVYSNNTVVSTLGVLPPGGVATVDFTAFPGITNLTTNTATVVGLQIDTNPVDNTSSTVTAGLGPAFDSDGDGMPDWWEELHELNPFSTNGVHGAAGDLDLDGVLNIDEWIADTRAEDASSFPRIESFEVQPGSVDLFFESSPIRRYLGRSSDVLQPPAFTTFETILGDGRPASVTDTNPPATNQFYQLEFHIP